MDGFKERLSDERNELGERIDKLNRYLSVEKLPINQAEVLGIQIKVMESYYRVLNLRINLSSANFSRTLLKNSMAFLT